MKMPSLSASQEQLNNGPKGETTRVKTAPKKNLSLSNDKNNLKQMKNKCRSSMKGIVRLKPFELDHKEGLKVVGISTLNYVKPSYSRKIRIYPTLLPKNELQRIKDASKYVNLEERLLKLKEVDEEKKRIQAECEKRKQILKEYDDARLQAKLEQEKRMKEMSRGSDVYDDDDDDRIKILDRAVLAKHENEEEIKRANQIILAAKCHVIREAQIMEKNELARELKEEDSKLENMMIEERDKALKVEELKKMHQNEIKHKYIQEIKNQLEERETRKLLEANRIEEEAKSLAQAAAVLQQEEERKSRIEKEKRAKLRSDLKKAAEVSAFFKKMEFEAEQQAELKILEYMKHKEEREQKLALEKQLAKEALKRQQNLLIYKQEKALTSKMEAIEIATRREQEKKEREFRQKEKDAALRKKQIEKELLESRQAQINDLNKRRAIQMANNEADFKRIVDNLRNIDAIEKEKDEKRRKDRERYREEIIAQINKREIERREEMKKRQTEHLAYLEKEKLREKNIQSIIQMKLNAMRNVKMPEKYVKEVEKQLQFSIKSN